MHLHLHHLLLMTPHQYPLLPPRPPPCKPPITRVYTRHSANHLESPSSPSSASLDAPVFVDSNATDESQVGPSYNLRDRTTIQPPNKLGFPRASAILEDHPLIMSLLSFRNGRLICLRSSLHLSAQVLEILFHYHPIQYLSHVNGYSKLKPNLMVALSDIKLVWSPEDFSRLRDMIMIRHFLLLHA